MAAQPRPAAMAEVRPRPHRGGTGAAVTVTVAAPRGQRLGSGWVNALRAHKGTKLLFALAGVRNHEAVKSNKINSERCPSMHVCPAISRKVILSRTQRRIKVPP